LSLPEKNLINFYQTSVMENTMRIVAIAALTLSSLFLVACGNNDQAAQVTEKAEAAMAEAAKSVEEATIAAEKAAAEAAAAVEAATAEAEAAIKAAEEAAVTTAE